MRPCFTILVHLLLCLPIWAIGQNGKIDSLKRVIETTKVDTVRGRTLCRLCDELRKVGKYEVALATGDWKGFEMLKIGQGKAIATTPSVPCTTPKGTTPAPSNPTIGASKS